jgi:hypothetical protein
LNALAYARSDRFPQLSEEPRHIPTLERWRNDRTRIEEALRHSDDELRAICSAIRERTFSLLPPDPNVHGKVRVQRVQELAEGSGQITMLEVWQDRRDRLAEALRRSDDDLVAVCTKACTSGRDPTRRAA